MGSFILLALSFYIGKEMEDGRGQIGVRFMTEAATAEQLDDLTGEAKDNPAGEAKGNQAEKDEEEWPKLTLWKKTENEYVSYEELGREIPVALIDVWGSVENIYPQCLSAGAPLIREDAGGCMLSGQAAYQLFGGTDVIGKKIRCGEKEYIVRGLLKLEEAVLVRENEEGSFNNIEAQGQPGRGTEKLRQMLADMGAALDDGAVIETDVFCGMLRLLRLIPALILLIFLCRIGEEKCGDRKILRCLLVVAGILMAAFLIGESWCFPDDFIPSRWSDFEFFGNLIKTQQENYRRYQDIGGIYKDILLFTKWKKAAVCIAASTVLAAAGNALRGH